MAATICPRCGCRFDPALHGWRRAVAMAGRVPGWQWSHRRPDNGKGCTYVDAGPTGGYQSGTAVATMVADEERDAPHEARMAG